jgi:hypothetical protein
MEGLHDLACVVLVGERAEGGVGLGVAQVAEIDAHDRAERHVLEELAEFLSAVDEDIVAVARPYVAVRAVLVGATKIR